MHVLDTLGALNVNGEELRGFSGCRDMSGEPLAD